jgi:wyosine [tRNA(Phe)-imidazoG37] synthetase (radical SAM superfamily)
MLSEGTYNYLFGPVPSRRLGRSLGIDLVPFKTCTMNCRFCQLGDSPLAVCERKEYVPTGAVLAELDRWLANGGEADHITLAGSGEPTLHTGFGEVLQWVRRQRPAPSVLLSNGSLFGLPEVREAAQWADKVKVTLSAWDEASFQALHRPANGVLFSVLLAGERAFRSSYSGEFSVEVFLVKGVNSSQEQLERLAELVDSLKPDRIDLNTAVRPPADSAVQALSAAEMAAAARLFGEKAVVAASFSGKASGQQALTSEGLLQLIQRHPATAGQLAQDFGVDLSSVEPLLSELVATEALRVEDRGGERYFFARL